jgi:zinc protease
MSKRVIYAVVIFIFLLNISAYAQQDSSAKGIINRYVEKIGGVQRWSTIHSTQFRDVVELNDGDSVEYITVKEYPNKYYQKTSYKNNIEVLIYNDGIGLDIYNGKIDTIHDVKRLDKLKLQSCILPDISYESLGYKMELLGTHKFNNFDSYEIELVSPNGAISWNYYDKESGLLRMVYQEDKSKTIFPDYREYKNCLYPYRMFFVLADGRVLDVQTRSILVNEKVDPNIFKP